MSPPKAQINSINNKESDYHDFAGAMPYIGGFTLRHRRHAGGR